MKNVCEKYLKFKELSFLVQTISDDIESWIVGESSALLFSQIGFCRLYVIGKTK